MASTFTVFNEGSAIRRTLKFASENSAGVQVRPHVLDGPPSVTTVSDSVSVVEVSMVVVVPVPPFHERATEMVPPAGFVLESSSFTGRPFTVFDPGTEKPKPP